MRNKRRWFAVHSMYRWVAKGKPDYIDSRYDADSTYVEMRIVLFRAHSHGEAIKLAKKEAKKYCSEVFINPYGQKVFTYLHGNISSFESFDNPQHGKEIYSALELFPSNLSATKYINNIHMQSPKFNIIYKGRKFALGDKDPIVQQILKEKHAQKAR